MKIPKLCYFASLVLTVTLMLLMSIKLESTKITVIRLPFGLEINTQNGFYVMTQAHKSPLPNDLDDGHPISSKRAAGESVPLNKAVTGDVTLAIPLNNDDVREKVNTSSVPMSSSNRRTQLQDFTSAAQKIIHITCSWNYLPPEVLDNVSPDRWRIVERDVGLVFSAYWDPRYVKHVVVRVFGLLAKERVAEYEEKPYYCRLWLRDSGEQRDSLVVPAVVEETSIPKKQRILDVTFFCAFPLSNIDPKDIKQLTFTRRSCDLPTFAMAVHQPRQDVQGYDREFTVCLEGPLRNNISDSRMFVEWIEINSILGAEKFYIYNFSPDISMDPYFDHYMQMDVLEMVDWHFPAAFSKVEWVKTAAQITLVNECLLRNMFRSKYVVYVDLDEVIVPRLETAHNWKELLEQVECYNKPYVSARHTMFMHDWPEGIRIPHNIHIAKKMNLRLLLRIKRSKIFNKYHARSKYMVRPEQMYNVLVHQARPLGDVGAATCILEPESGALHHYRSRILPKTLEEPMQVDQTLLRFADELVRRVTNVHKKVNDTLLN